MKTLRSSIVLFLFFLHQAYGQHWVYLDSVYSNPYCIELLYGDQYVIFATKYDSQPALIQLNGSTGGLEDSLLISFGGLGAPCCYPNDLIQAYPNGDFALFISDLTLDFPYNDEIVQYKFDANLDFLSKDPIGFGFFSPLELAYDVFQNSDSTVIVTGFVQDSNDDYPLLVFEYAWTFDSILWSHAYPPAPGGIWERGVRIVPALDGGYFIVGRNLNPNFPCFVKRITHTGQEIWTNFYDGAAEADAVHGADSSIVITSLGTVFKIDYNGNVLWKHQVMGCPGETCYFARKIRRTADGRYVTIGLKGSFENGQVIDYIGLYFYSEQGQIEEKYFFEGTEASYNPIDFAPTDDGEYIVVSTLTGGFLHVFKTNIQQIQPPAAGFTFETSGLAVSFTDTSSHQPTSWLWSFGDGLSSDLQHPAHLFAEPGEYNVCLTVANQHGSDTLCQILPLLPSILKEPAPASPFRLFPNPATERLTLQILDPSGPEWELEIVNVFGQPLYRRQVPVGAQALPLNIESLPAGVYFLTLRSVKGQHWHFEVLKVE